MIKTTIVDENGSELQVYANDDNKLYISITQSDMFNIFDMVLELDDAIELQKMLNSSIKLIKEDI